MRSPFSLFNHRYQARKARVAGNASKATEKSKLARAKHWAAGLLAGGLLWGTIREVVTPVQPILRGAKPVATLAAKDSTTEIVFIDAAVSNTAALELQLRAGVRAVKLTPDSGAIGRITEVLSQAHDLKAVHLISSGQPGALVLGGEVLDAAAVEQLSGSLKAWGRSLAKGGNVFVYAGSAARGTKGDALVKALARVTGAAVSAASDNEAKQRLCVAPSLPSGAEKLQLESSVAVRAIGDFDFTDAGDGGINPGTGPYGYGPIAVWADVDNDGLLDLATSGYNGTLIWHNEGDGTFTQLGPEITANGYGFKYATLDFGDFDNDGQLDLAICDPSGFYGPTYAFHNSQGHFTDIGLIPPGINDVLGGNHFYATGLSTWGDFNNDGHLDLLISQGVIGIYDALSTGYTFYESAVIAVNNGDGTFSIQLTNVPGLYARSVWADIDGDGDLDIVVTGYDAYNQVDVTEVYRNDDGVFLPLGANLAPLHNSSVAIGDYNNDGLMDLAIIGLDESDNSAAHIYRNDGGGVFTDILAPLQFTGFNYGQVSWGDFDNDGDLDLLIVSPFYGPLVYRNDGNDTFVDTLANFGDAAYSIYAHVAWGDIDRDGDLDLAVFTEDAVALYVNNSGIQNLPPDAPSNLTAVPAGNSVALNWNVPLDDHTPGPGLSYSLLVGSTPGGFDVVCPPANPVTGRRRLPAHGEINGPGCTLNALPNGTYYWSVQAVDAAFNGSPFSVTGSFVIGGSQPTPPAPTDFVSVSLTTPAPNPLIGVNAFTVAIHLDKQVDLATFTLNDFVVTNGAASALTLTNANSTFVVTITPAAEGDVTVKIPAGVLSSTSGKLNNASNLLTINVQAIAQNVGVTLSSTAPTTQIGFAPFPVTITFSKKIDPTSFDITDLAVINGTALGLTATTAQLVYTVNIKPTAAGNVSVIIPAGVLLSTTGKPNNVSNAIGVSVSADTLTVALSTTAGHPQVGLAPFPVTITFSKNIDPASFTLSDIAVNNGTASGLNSTTGNSVYTVNITPAAAGNVTVVLAASMVTSASGTPNNSSNTLIVQVVTPTPPVDSKVDVQLSTTAANPQLGLAPFTVQITFSQAIDPASFTLGDISVSNGTLSALTTVTPNTVFSVTVTPSAAANVTLVIAAGKLVSPGGNPNTVSNTLVVQVQPAPAGVPVAVTLSTTATSPQTGLAAFPVSIVFSKDIDPASFTLDDITVTNGTASGLSVSSPSSVFGVTITPTAAGDVTVSIAAGKMATPAGDANTVSNTIAVQVQSNQTEPFAATLSTTAANPQSGLAAFPVSIVFDKAIDPATFTLDDITVGNGSAAGLKALTTVTANTSFSVSITPAAAGDVTVSIAAGKISTASGALNSVSNALKVTVQNSAPPAALPVFASAPTATPSPAIVGQPVAFSAAANSSSAVTYSWNFGDGTSATGAAVSHSFSPAGTYAVTVAAKNDSGTVSVPLSVVVSPVTGTAGGGSVLPGEIDSDGDGFSDILENEAGTDPLNAANNPGGSISSPLLAQIKEAKVKVNAKRKTLTLTGKLGIPADFVVTGKMFVVDVEGYTRKFTLDKKGGAKNGKDSTKLTIKVTKKKVLAQDAKVKLTLTNIPSTVKQDSPLMLMIGGAVFTK